jgi:glycosyltransferase involved in cell wall biosynthesis
MQGLRRKYHIEMACAPGGPLYDLTEQTGIPVLPIKDFVSEAAPFKDIHAFWQVYRLLRKGNYDLIHTHNSKGGFIGRLAAKLAGGIPVIHGVHGYAFHKNEPWLRRALFFLLEYLARNWSVRIICISQPLVDLWVKKKLAPVEKIRKIYSGIDVQEFKQFDKRDVIRQKLGLQQDAIAIGQVSKLWEGKGHIDIIAACPDIVKALPGAKVFFIGDGPIRNKLENIVLQNGLQDRIIFLGHRRDVVEVTSALDIAILASYYEGMGRVILEAMAAGLPVVATRVGGIVDLVVDQETGLLIDPHSPQQIADAVIRLAKDSALRKTMGLLGKKRVDNRFSAATMVEQIDQLYQEVFVENEENSKNH